MPIVADIHFHYKRAIEAAEAGAACLRINPGNIGSADRVREVVKAAKDHGCSMRIGVNAGSLEKDLLEKYGEPCPEAMVESALDHARILQDHDFHEFKISVKASDVFLAVAAYQQLADACDYPLHLGVTEAGGLRTGTVKSSIGMGSLLWAGIGDTIRVSLSAEPEEEVHVGFEMLKALNLRHRGVNIISCPSCARQQFDVIRTVEALEKRVAHITTPMTVSVIGCVVNGPGEARETDIGFTGGGNNTHQVYIAGVPHHRLKDGNVVDHLVDADREEGGRDRGRQGRRRSPKPTDIAPPPSSDLRPLPVDIFPRRFPVSKLQPVRGTHDLLPDEYRRFAHVVDTARDVARLYGYREMATPIFEFTELFARGIGETTDVVSKEMYTFKDRGGESLTLRPEYTAGICRAFVSNGELTQQLPLKVFAAGPMFRYERPQKGRQRQFHQIDIEVLGAPEPGADIEVISVAADILDRLGILDRCVLKINSLGDPESRAVYRKVLVDYYSAHIGKLSEDSKSRLQRNPLRILDSKDEGDKAINADAPSFADHLNQASRDFFAAVQDGLAAAGIAFEVDPAPGARARLLHPHRLRVRHHPPRRAGHRAGRRPL